MSKYKIYLQYKNGTSLFFYTMLDEKKLEEILFHIRQKNFVCIEPNELDRRNVFVSFDDIVFASVTEEK